MRKVLLASLLAIGFTFGGGTAIGAPPEAKGGGPACADIVGAYGYYIAPGTIGEGTLTTELEMAGPSCKGMTYTIYVLDDRPGDRVVASRSVRGNKDESVLFDPLAVPDDDSAVCVYATVSAGARVFDRAPAEGCAVPVVLEVGPLGGGGLHDYRWGP